MSFYLSFYLVITGFLLFLIIITTFKIIKSYLKIKKNSTNIFKLSFMLYPVVFYIISLLLSVLVIYFFFPTTTLVKRIKEKQKGPIIILNMDCNWYVKKHILSGGRGNLNNSLYRIASLFDEPAAFRINFFEKSRPNKVGVNKTFYEFTIPDEKYKSKFVSTFFYSALSPTIHNKDLTIFRDKEYYAIRGISAGTIRRYIKVLKIIEEVKSYMTKEKEKEITVDVFVVIVSMDPGFQTYLTSSDLRGGGSDSIPPRREIDGLYYYYSNIVLSRRGAFNSRSEIAFQRLKEAIKRCEHKIDFSKYEPNFGIRKEEVKLFLLIVLGVIIICFFVSIIFNSLEIKI